MAEASSTEHENPRIPSVAREWWRSVGENRAERADLRRTKDPTEVMFVPAFHRLLWAVRRSEESISPERLAVLAGVLSHVDHDALGIPLGRRLGEPVAGRARMSGLRFRRLLSEKSAADLFSPLIRSIHLIDRTAPIADLVRVVRFWGDHVKRDLAVHYYEAAPRDEK